jgi:hypothetical protein
MKTKHRSEPKIPRFRWWIVLLIILGAVAVLTHKLGKPLPPPLVSLNLVGFKVISANTFAVMSLSNAGPTRVYFDPRDWTAQFQTSEGPITNHGSGFSYASLGTKQHSNEVFYIEIPGDTVNWRAEAGFSYYKRRHLRLEFAAWAVDTGVWNSVFRKPFEAFDPEWVAKQEPSESYGLAATVWLTNLPPTTVAE